MSDIGNEHILSNNGICESKGLKPDGTFRKVLDCLLTLGLLSGGLGGGDQYDSPSYDFLLVFSIDWHTLV